MKKLIIAMFFLLIGNHPIKAQQMDTNQIYFGSYTSASVSTRSWMTVSCRTTYSIALDQGLHGTNVTNREMKANRSQKTISYQLFTDAAYTRSWGNTAASEVTGTDTGYNLKTVYVYALIPALQAFSSSGNDSYSDSVNATLTCGSTTMTKSIAVGLQEVDPGCGISASDLSFGNYTGTILNATTTLQVGCSSGTSYNVGLNAGNATDATVSNRSMTLTGGTVLLNYELRQKANGPNWGNTVKVDTVAGTANGAIQSLTVYGVIPAGQSVTQGTYNRSLPPSPIRMPASLCQPLFGLASLILRLSFLPIPPLSVLEGFLLMAT